MNYPGAQIKTLDVLSAYCALPKGELLNHIASCFKRFVDMIDYVNHNQYLSNLNNVKCICYNAVTIPVTCFQCDNQAVSIVLARGPQGGESLNKKKW